MLEQVKPWEFKLWFDISGYYVVILTTLFVCILIALYIANYFKGDKDVYKMDKEDNIYKRKEDNDNESNDEESELSSADDANIDFGSSVNYSNLDLVGKFQAQHFNMVKKLTPSQMEEERRIEREQLAAIFELLRKQEAELNLKERISDQELKDQVRLYR
ncbi:matrix-remodeling-associated protein 7 [Drosophila busckii]|uniref:matrix-remodeling-associated protein 7 n=1 Tax=Drosophila busckii TaxID=30019 RepID=UPI001432C11A|nr:matrix-remodeling-associated protein 7 [Drosophila busckii]